MPRHLHSMKKTIFESIHRLHKIRKLVVFLPESLLFTVHKFSSYMN